MNVQMLKYLTVLSSNEVDTVDIDKFFNKFSKDSHTLKDLSTLSQLGYINIFSADDTISEINVNKRALDYFK